MSEYQYVAFRAIDAPVSKANLQYMRKQSSRAEITPWAFENEYHYGDFSGNVAEMLRRGYDFHLHYSNFGDRKLMIRLPNGLPDEAAAEPYLEKGALEFRKDKDGPGGILSVTPYIEDGDVDESWAVDELLERLLPLRAEILEGDLRPLYLARLAIAFDSNHGDEKEKDAPVPAGLEKLTDAQRALAEFHGLRKSLIAAAANGSPPLVKSEGDPKNDYDTWLREQPETRRNSWLAQLMADADSGVRNQMLAEYLKSHKKSSWPVVLIDRTLGNLTAAADEIRKEGSRRKAETTARQRAQRLADMATDPTPTHREIEKLVKERTQGAYHKIALLLADLREALANTSQPHLAEFYAHDLKSKNPTLALLTKELRGKGFLKK